jgi:hypothetical protein
MTSEMSAKVQGMKDNIMLELDKVNPNYSLFIYS